MDPQDGSGSSQKKNKIMGLAACLAWGSGVTLKGWSTLDFKPYTLQLEL